MKKFKVRISEIDYDISGEDIIDYAASHGMDFEEADLEMAEKQLREELPESLEVVIRCSSRSQVGNFCADAVTEVTGMLVNSCSYDIIEEVE